MYNYHPDKKVNLVNDIATRIRMNSDNQFIDKKQAEEIARKWISGMGS